MTPSARSHDTRWERLSELIAERMGLHFPRERLPDLQRGIAGAAEELGFQDLAAFIDMLVATPLSRPQLHVLATHLTVGETYFFRDPQMFEVLASQVLPELIRSRRGRRQRLRLWSAACATGEEAYSLAILLQQIVPDLAGWHVTILATDINARALRTAVAGVYGSWSFRGVPEGVKERYFSLAGDGRHSVRPEVRHLVTFEHLNLVEDVYPSLATDTNAMDVIVCRNVLMYFTAAQIHKVVGHLRRALVDGGWLVVSPGEASAQWFPQFATASFPGVLLYQKRDTERHPQDSGASASLHEHEPLATPIEIPLPLAPATVVQPAEPPPNESPEMPPPDTHVTAGARAFYEQGRYGEAADTLLSLCANDSGAPEAFSLLARALANQGRLQDARAWCDRWIAANRLDPAAYYLRAVVLLEDGQADEARRSLQRAVYLEPDFVLAHFALGTLARSSGRHEEAGRHFGNALRPLARLQPDDVLPESDGLTAGRLAETITALTALRTDDDERRARRRHA